MAGLTPSQKAQYDSDGFVHIKGVFADDECDALVEHMVGLHAGRIALEGFAPRQPDDWGRTHNQHLYDNVAMDWLLDERVREPLRDCMDDEPEGVQTMYFWKGSQQRRHQDQYYLPGCMGVWIAFQDTSPANGTLCVQTGSHKMPLIRQQDFVSSEDSPAPLFGQNYDDAVDALFERNALPEVPVIAKRGDAIFFHGVLIHRGGPILEPGAFRHTFANHYVPRGFTGWPYGGWPRIAFDGSRRFDNGE